MRVVEFAKGRPVSTTAEMMETALEVAALSRDLVEISMDGAHRSNLQRQRVLEVVVMEEQIRSAAAKNGEDSREALQWTKQVFQDTEAGNQALESTVRSMEMMCQTVSESAEMMSAFVKRMAEVDSIVRTISRIARQTNLLALNAAIQAAHAGVHGDGFNVIAHEIRQLADEAGASTLEIVKNIASMMTTASTAEISMQSGRKAALTSIEHTLELQRGFQSIRSAVQKVTSMSETVALESAQQIAAGDRVSTAVTEVDGLAVKGMEESDAAAEMSLRLVSQTSHFTQMMAKLHPETRRSASRSEDTSRELLGKLEDRGGRLQDAMTLLAEQAAMAGPASVRCSEDRRKNIPRVAFRRFGCAGDDAVGRYGPCADRLRRDALCEAGRELCASRNERAASGRGTSDGHTAQP